MIPREPWPRSAVGARCFLGPLIHLSLSCLRKLLSFSLRPGSRQTPWERLFIPASFALLLTTVTGGFLISRRGPRPATTFYPRRPIGRTPHAVCVVGRSREAGTGSGPISSSASQTLARHHYGTLLQSRSWNSTLGEAVLLSQSLAVRRSLLSFTGRMV
jgi:hypothetical protein